MSYRFRTFCIMLLAALAVSAAGKVIPPSKLAAIFGEARPEVSASRKHSESVGRNLSAANLAELDSPKQKPAAQFTVYQNADGEVECREATPEERKERASI